MMIYPCPKCGRFGMAWDGRAKVFMCHWMTTCGHVIRTPGWKTEPPANVAYSLIQSPGPRCIVKGCTNRQGEGTGTFVGELCEPCHEMLVAGKIGPTSSFLGDMAKELEEAKKTHG